MTDTGVVSVQLMHVCTSISSPSGPREGSRLAAYEDSPPVDASLRMLRLSSLRRTCSSIMGSGLDCGTFLVASGRLLDRWLLMRRATALLYLVWNSVASCAWIKAASDYKASAMLAAIF